MYEEILEPTETAQEANQFHQSPPAIVIEESPPPPMHFHQEKQFRDENFVFPQSETQIPVPEVRKLQMGGGGSGVTTERVRVLRRPNGDFAPRVISGRFTTDTERTPVYDLVEPMQYLFVRIVKGRGLSANESPYVKIQTGTVLEHFV